MPYPPPLPPGPPRRSNAPAIIAIVAVVAVCVLGAVGAVCGGLVLLDKDRSSDSYTASSDDTETSPEDGYTPAPARSTTPPAPAPVTVGQCIAVDEAGQFLGIGNCNGSSGTYKVLSVDHAQSTCADPQGPYITVTGYRLCLALYLVRSHCYKFPQSTGWVVAASKCKAPGTVLIVDIVPNANNGDGCTRDYQWNRWYRSTHPTVVYCVMQY